MCCHFEVWKVVVRALGFYITGLLLLYILFSCPMVYTWPYQGPWQYMKVNPEMCLYCLTEVLTKKVGHIPNQILRRTKTFFSTLLCVAIFCFGGKLWLGLWGFTVLDYRYPIFRFPAPWSTLGHSPKSSARFVFSPK